MPNYRKPLTIWSFIFSVKGLVLGVLVCALITAVVAQSQGLSLFSRAASNSALLAAFPDTDPQTKELYDVVFSSTVRVASQSAAGPTFIAESLLRVKGPRFQNLPSLYAIKQTTESPYPTTYQFTRDTTGGEVSFFVPNMRTLYNNCIDLYSSASPMRETYIVTLCYNNTYVIPNPQHNNPVLIYSPAGNPFISSEYTGTRTAVVQVWSTAFNKYTKPVGSENGVLMTRVNYVALDTANAPQQVFKNTKYVFQTLTGGLSSTQINALCYSPVNNPQKYLQVAPAPKPGLGSTLIDMTQFSGCTGSVVTQELQTGFLSLWMYGGVPVPGEGMATPTPPQTTATPSPVPSFPPTPTPSPTPTTKLTAPRTVTPIKVAPSSVPIPKLPIN